MHKKGRTAQSLPAKPDARRMNGFTQGVESQPFPLVHRAIGDSRSNGQREDRAGQFRRGSSRENRNCANNG